MPRAEPDADLAAAFAERTGRRPEGIWSAPGRATLIGEHLDYNEGIVLPFALGLRTRVALARRDDGRVRCWSLQRRDAADVRLDDAPRTPGWAGYVVGTIWALREAGVDTAGADVVVDGRVPPGAGLASSAALECATALAVDELTGAGLDRLDLARAGQRAERDVVGAPVGLMDQVASLAARAGHAVRLDCRSLAIATVPLPLAQTGTKLVVIDTRVGHQVPSGQYAERRLACERAAALLAVPALRDATIESVESAPLDVSTRRRARHVVTEQARVHAALAALDAGDMPGLGRLMTESHSSLAHDYEVSVPALDATVDAAVRAGALGARLSGAGFGGAVVVLVPAERVDAVLDNVDAVAARQGRPAPHSYDGAPAAGARRES